MQCFRHLINFAFHTFCSNSVSIKKVDSLHMYIYHFVIYAYIHTALKLYEWIVL